MGIQNSRALLGGRPAAQRALQSRINIHGLPGVRVPAGRVTIPTGTHAVRDYYLMDPATKGLVQEWARVDGRTPFVRLAMETARSPHNPGQLHVVQRGVDASHMEFIPEAEMIADYDLDVEQGHLELVGAPIDVLTWPANNHANNQGHTDDAMSGLIIVEQVALAAFLNRVTIDARVVAHLGAFNMVSEAQIVHAAWNQTLFEGSVKVPGVPSYVAHWTRDLYDPTQLNLPANDRINVRRVWRGSICHFDGTSPVVFRGNGDDGNLPLRLDNNVAQFAVLPLPQDSNP